MHTNSFPLYIEDNAHKIDLQVHLKGEIENSALWGLYWLVDGYSRQEVSTQLPRVRKCSSSNVIIWRHRYQFKIQYF